MNESNKSTRIYVCHVQPPSKCEFCGQEEELRPYGPKGEAICFDCAMKDEATTRKMFCTTALGMTEAEFEASEKAKKR